jgi:hypothetical protein
MIKWILVVLTAVYVGNVDADEAYSQSRCDSIKKERASIRSQMRSGYSVEKGERLKARFKQLFTVLANHCDKAKPNSTSSYTRNVRTYSSSSNWLLNQKTANMTLHSDSYRNDAKRDAWAKFYKLPDRCRKKNMTSSEFVWCSEYRGKQKSLFEAQWKARP